MALWRVADWAGAFDAGSDGDDVAKPVHAVIDISSRSVKVLLTEGSDLVEMRVLRFGDSVASELVARAHSLDSEQARLTVEECLRTGADVHVESVAALPALNETSEASGEAGGDDDVDGATEEASQSAVTRTELVTYSEVEAANAKYLQRLGRELTRCWCWT